jgi:DNA-binding CsgD family transcriptional regulator
MDAVDDSRTTGDPTTVDGTVPASLSDVLHLMATQDLKGIAPEILQKLDRANLAFIRGAPVTALRLVDQAIQGLEPPMAADVLAFRLFLRNMMADASLRPTHHEIESASTGSGPLSIVALCIKSNHAWYSGNLFEGLWLSHSAFQRAHGVAGVWQFYAGLLITKKLTNLHISNQAFRLVGELRSLIDGSGLYAFGSLPDALHSVLYLQAGDLTRAAESAACAIDIARQRDTVVGTTISLSVSAQAHIGKGEFDRAASDLAAYDSQPSHYADPDSLARATAAGIAVLSVRDGPGAAAKLMRMEWPRLVTRSACFVEDPSRPAWLVAVALRAGDTELAKRVLSAVERLAAANPAVSLLETAANRARTAFAGEGPSRLSVPDFAAHRRQAPRRSKPADEDEPPSMPRPRLSSLSQRESEIARLVGRGMTNRQVANRLGVSPHTVNFHLRSIFRKLAISTRVNLGQLFTQADQGDCSCPRAVTPHR